MRNVFVVSVGIALTAFVCSPTVAQSGPTFSIDFQGPTAGGPGPFTGMPGGFAGIPVDEGQILTTALPGPPGPNPPAFPGPGALLPPPGVMVTAVPWPPFGSVPGGLGIVPGRYEAVEVDALSYGRDRIPVLQANGVNDSPFELFFSVDEWAIGIPNSPMPPNVWTEGANGKNEASADVFTYLGPPGPIGPPPILPPASPWGNTDVIDGDGIAPFGGPGTGLRDLNPPSQGPDEGDNLDAVDVNSTLRDVKGLIFFSMDSAFPDPLEAMYPPVNSGTAAGNFDANTGIAFVGGDVVVTTAGGLPTLYASANALGLDMIAGGIEPDTDDLDALALWDDGVLDAAGENPTFSPQTDVILFSVRRGSAVIGMPDSRFNAPIEPGDVLQPPLPGGASQFPAIYIAAEALGLSTFRAGGAADYSDDLDALDVVPEPGSIVLLTAGGLALAMYAALRRRRRKA